MLASQVRFVDAMRVGLRALLFGDFVIGHLPLLLRHCTWPIQRRVQSRNTGGGAPYRRHNPGQRAYEQFPERHPAARRLGPLDGPNRGSAPATAASTPDGDPDGDSVSDADFRAPTCAIPTASPRSGH